MHSKNRAFWVWPLFFCGKYIIILYITLMKSQSDAQSFLREAAQIHHMEKGSLHVLRQGPSGPYYNLQFSENGKHVSRYVPQDQVDDLRQAIDGYRQFTRLSDQYAQLVIERTRAELAGAKKKTRPSSSSPKRRKSPNS